MKRILVIGISVLVFGLMAFTLVSEREPLDSMNVSGKYPIDFSLEDKEGNKVNLSDYEGKVVVLNFWASWCGPCVFEMPDLQRFYDNADSDEVAVLAIALDRNFDASKSFMNKKGYSIPYFKPNGKVPSEFSISAIPVTFVLDKQGNIISTYTGATEFGADYFLDAIELAKK